MKATSATSASPTCQRLGARKVRALGEAGLGLSLAREEHSAPELGGEWLQGSLALEVQG